MIFTLLGPLLLTAAVIAALPFLLVLGPPLYAYRVCCEAGYAQDESVGLAMITFGYALLIVWRVHSSAGLLFGLVVVPMAMAWLVRRSH